MEDSNFDLAFGITAYDSVTESIEDPTIGQIEAMYVTWGIEPGFSGVKYEPLGIHTCTKEELGLDEENRDNTTRFNPIHHNSYNDTSYYSKKLKCFDDKLQIQGDYNSYKARVLKIVFVKCNNETMNNTC